MSNILIFVKHMGGVIKMHVYGFIYIIWNYPNIYIIKIIDNKKQIE